jgi:hypothetical protein
VNFIGPEVTVGGAFLAEFMGKTGDTTVSYLEQRNKLEEVQLHLRERMDTWEQVNDGTGKMD